MSDERRVPRLEEDRMSGFGDEEQKRPLPATRGGALEIVDFGDDAGAGGDNIDLDELVTPFLRLLQGLSPEINPTKAEYVHGAQLGMILNTASKEFYGKEGIDAIVCDRAHHYGKWVPRDLGGGFRGIVGARDPLVLSALAKVGNNKFRLPRYRSGQWVSGKSNVVVEPTRDPESGDLIELVETGQLYLLYAPHGQLLAETARRAIVSMTSTAMPKYTEFVNRWLNWTYPQQSGGPKPAPLWAYRYHFTSVADSNDLGEFFNWSTRLLPEGSSARDALLMPDDPLYVTGRAFYQLIREGKVKVDQESAGGVRSDDAPPF